LEAAVILKMITFILQMHLHSFCVN